jgi:hypothetical protein
MGLRAAIKNNGYRLITALIGDQDRLRYQLSKPAKGLKIRANLIDRKDVYFWGKYDRYILGQVIP